MNSYLRQKHTVNTVTMGFYEPLKKLTSRIQAIVTRWINNDEDRSIVKCIPYINSDIWAAYILYKEYRESLTEEMTKEALDSFLLSRPKEGKRLIRRQGKRIKKNNGVYLEAMDELTKELLIIMQKVFPQLEKFCLGISETIWLQQDI